MGLKKKKGKKKEKNVRLYIVSNGTIYKFIYIYIYYLIKFVQLIKGQSKMVKEGEGTKKK